MLKPCDQLRSEIQMYLMSRVKHLERKEDILASWGIGWNAIVEAQAANGEENNSSVSGSVLVGQGTHDEAHA